MNFNAITIWLRQAQDDSLNPDLPSLTNMPAAPTSRPLVSIVMPVHNEAAHIASVVQSLLDQQRSGFDLEVLVIDSNSKDGTREILRRLAAANPAVRLLLNPQEKTPLAFNIGLREARGEYACIFGAHTVYDPDYIAVCLENLHQHDAVGCGGRVLTTAANSTLSARLVAAAVGSSFGTSRKSFRNHPEGFADTVNYPVYRRGPVMEAGGYDEQLHRNQDIDLNQRLRTRGHRLYMTWATSCRYFVQPTVRGLMAYAWKNGFWNAISLRRNAAAHALYHFIPGIFVLSIVSAALCFLMQFAVAPPYRYWFALPLGLVLLAYFGTASLVAAREAVRRRWPAGLLLPFVFFAFHIAYGLGILWALISNAQTPQLADPVGAGNGGLRVRR